MCSQPLSLLAKHAVIGYLNKWRNQFPLEVQPIQSDKTGILISKSSSIDINSTLFLDSISFVKSQFSTEQPYLITFERGGTVCKRVLLILPTNKCVKPNALLASELFFHVFGDSLFKDTFIKDINLYEQEIQVANEVWLSPIKTLCCNESVDSELVDYFQTSRLLYSNDTVSIEYPDIIQTTTFYFRVALKESPLWVDSSTKIFQSPSTSGRYPRETISISQTFVPSGIRKLVEEARHILDPLFKEESGSFSMIVCLLAGSLGFGKDLCLDLMADTLCVNRLNFDCHELWNTEGKSTESVVNSWFERITELQPCIIELKNLTALRGNPTADLESGIKILGVLSNCIHSFKGRSAMFITATKSELATLPQAITKQSHFEFVCNDLNEEDRQSFFEFVRANYSIDFPAKWLTDCIRGLVLSELNQLLSEAIVNSHCTVNSHGYPILQRSAFEHALEQRKKAFGESIGVPKIPNVTWDDVGGLDDVKQLISESLRANLNLNRPPNMRRSGIVLWGAPGCGKTLIAKAVATEFNMTFLSVKGPELLNQYIGQSEHNLRQVFEKARLASPSIIFFDELDSLAPSRGVAGDSAGVMDRMVSQLLSELDELQTRKDCAVFVMGATNRPDLLDTCLLSSGRFDKLIEVKMATDLDTKVRILESICKKVNLAEDLSPLDIVLFNNLTAKQCTTEMSGAELSALISTAGMHAIRSSLLDAKVPDNVRIERKHVQKAIGGLITSKHLS